MSIILEPPVPPPTADDAELAQALKKRYRTKKRGEIQELFHQEIGLKPYRLRIRPEAQEGKLGTYTQDDTSARIRYNPHEAPDTKIATMAHELGHAADHIYYPPASSKNHHRDFAEFEPEMALVMRAQSDIENGKAVDPAILKKYPFLRSVTPASSNRLANPWTDQKPAEEPAVWNLIR